MKHKKFLLMGLIFSVLCFFGRTSIVCASEILDQDIYTEDSSEEEINIEEEIFDEYDDAETSDSLEADDVSDNEESEDISEDDILEDLEDEFPEELEEPEEENLFHHVTFSTKKEILRCQEDHTIKKTEIQLNSFEISSDEGIDLDSLLQCVFENGTSSDEKAAHLLALEKEAFLSLSLPEEYPSSLEITFRINDTEDQILSVTCNY